MTPALLRQRALFATGRGQLAYAGRFLALCAFFDQRFRQLARRHGAIEHAYPALISVDTLRRLDYFSSFPQLATFAAHFEGRHAASRFGARGGGTTQRLAAPTHMLRPAICYHAYDILRGRTLGRRPWRVTAVGPCFRHEGGTLSRTPERLWTFTMREIIFFGSRVEVERVRQRLMDDLRRLAATTAIDARIEEAHDPFFLGAARGKLIMQKLKRLKYELRAEVRDRRRLALASLNHHEDFFGRRMRIRLFDGAIAHSGCVAFGIERWAYAFLCQNGLDPAGWPDRVRREVLRDEAG